MTLEQCRDAVDKSVHAGGAFSCIIPLVSLYYGEIMDIDVRKSYQDRTGYVYFKQRACNSGIGFCLCRSGVLWQDILKNSRSIDSILNGHPGPLLPGIHVSTGPLGQGLSASTGLSIAGKKIPSLTCIVYLETERSRKV